MKIRHLEWLGAGAFLLVSVGCGGTSARQPSARSEPPRAEDPTTVEMTGPTPPVAEQPLAPATVALPTNPAVRAEAELKTLDGSSSFGTVTFAQLDGKVSVVGRFTGLTPGMHGFYVHTEGDCGGKLAARAGLHFNPGKVKHGPIGGMVRHVGDFGNLSVDKEGHATFEMSTDSLTVTPGPDSIVGRAIIIHARKDDGKTQPSGSAGAAVGCGVIAVAGETSATR